MFFSKYEYHLLSHEYTFIRLFQIEDENILNLLNIIIETVYKTFNIKKFNNKLLKMIVFKFYCFIL